MFSPVLLHWFHGLSLERLGVVVLINTVLNNNNDQSLPVIANLIRKI